MYQFFSSSAKGAELLILRGKMGILHTRKEYLANSYDEANRQIEKLEGIQSDAQNRESLLMQQQVHKDIECEQKHQEQIHFEIEHEKLEEGKRIYEQELQAAIANKDEKEQQRDTLKQTKDTLEEQIAALRIEMTALDSIINSHGPRPRYKLDGLVCINGIPNCKNHPPRQVLENPEEIKQHQRYVNDTILVKQNLQSKISNLQEEYNKLINQIASAETEYLSAQVNCIQMQDKLKAQEIKLEENSTLQEQAAREYEIFLHEMTDIQNQIQLTKVELDRVASELEIAKQNAMSIQNDQQLIDSDMQTLSAQIEQLVSQQFPNRQDRNQLDLEELARKEVMQEEAKKQSQFYDRQALEELARRELDAEAEPTNNNLDGNLIINAADLLLNGAIDAARAAGRITEQARINLRNIKNFGNNALNDLNKKIDEFDSDPNLNQKSSP